MPLPFGLKLKRTRRYTVSSKSCLVTRIQLLNGEFVEFTLSVESTGQECLEAVAQRLELREVRIVLSRYKALMRRYCPPTLLPDLSLKQSWLFLLKSLHFIHITLYVAGI